MSNFLINFPPFHQHNLVCICNFKHLLLLFRVLDQFLVYLIILYILSSDGGIVEKLEVC